MDHSGLVLFLCGLLSLYLMSNCCVSSPACWADQDPPAATTLLGDTLVNRRVDTRMEQPRGPKVIPRAASWMGKHMLMGGSRAGIRQRRTQSRDAALGSGGHESLLYLHILVVVL